MRNILFYKFVNLDNLEKLKEEIYELADSFELKGKILIAKEGINGCLTGDVENTNKFKKELKKRREFSDIDFKEGDTFDHNFKRLIIKIRNEIITMKHDYNIDNKAPYVEPEELKDWLDSGEEVILIDTRNDYEYEVGSFKDAINPKIKEFSEWPAAVDKLKHLKGKKIVTFCTGGIRCEKATAVMKEKGFDNVYQLHGGILTYGKECGDAHWNGQCFVFDYRWSVELDEKKQKNFSCQL